MKKIVSGFSFVTICLLFVVSNAQAITIDSLYRHITLFQTTTGSSATGTFDEGLSWDAYWSRFDVDYNVSRGVRSYGGRGYQNSSFEYNSTTMTAGGSGGLNVWLPNTYNIFVNINSRFDLLFTPLTGASYTFLDGSDGGTVTFKDTTTPGFLYSGSGYLMAGHQYRFIADASISVNTDPTDGLNSGSYFGFELTVNEIPSNVPVPEPATMLLLGLGLVGLAGVRRKLN